MTCMRLHLRRGLLNIMDCMQGDDMAMGSVREPEPSRGEDGGAESADADIEGQCGSGLGDGGEGEQLDAGPFSALKDLDTTEHLKQHNADDLVQEHEYYDHYFNSSIIDPDDEYYGAYDDAYYLPAE